MQFTPGTAHNLSTEFAIDRISIISSVLTPSELEALFLNDTPLLDVRAPVEVAKGSLPNATNLPLLDNQQRHDIGLRYAEAGEEAAIALGLELATPAIRAERLAAWKAFITHHPDGYLFCFRGGLRSRTTQQWLRDEGIDYPLIPGGYKALRRFLLTRMQELIAEGHARVVTGPTGSGKTVLLHAWPQSVDLEGLANHKGSAFGQAFTPQPAQIDWEHNFTLSWMRRRQAHPAPILLEDESRLIGRVYLPDELQKLIATVPELRLHATLDQRINRLRLDYVTPILEHFQATQPAECWAYTTDHISQNLQRIRKRLGGARHSELQTLLPDAVAALRVHRDWGGFDRLISLLLTEYYDPMYDYQRGKSTRPVAVAGTHDELLTWLQQQDGQPESAPGETGA